jgi:PAS domain S-box-containing protein
MILLALLGAAGIALIEYRRTHNPDQERIVWAFSVLFLLRIPLLFGSPFRLDQASSSLPMILNAIIPLLLYALEVSSLTLLWWAFLSPLIERRWGQIFLWGNLGGAVLLTLIFFPSWYRMLQAFSILEYATFWQQTIWDIWATLISLSAAILLFTYRRRLGYILPTISFGLLTLGNALAIFELPGLGRLINLIGYPLLVVAVYRAALQDLYAYRQELETLSEESLRQTRELLFLLEVSQALSESLALDTMLRNVAESVAHALDADRTAILLADKRQENLNLAVQYIPLLRPEKMETGRSIALSEDKMLDHVVRRRKQVVLDPQRQPRRLRDLYRLLDSPEQGPVILQPLLHQQRVSGVLVVGRERSKKPFSNGEARLCESVAPQVAAAIENARLYQRLTTALHIQKEEAGRRKAILESISEGIIVTDAQGNAVLVNAAAQEIMEIQSDHVVGRPLQRLLDSVAVDREIDLERLQELDEPLNVLFELQNKQVQVSAAPVRPAKDEKLGVVAVLRDVTKEIQAEKTKRDFIAVISHELRTPLTAILGYAEALYGGMAGELSWTQNRFVHTIHENARRMVTMADNLIALSEAERGHLELEYGEVDLALIIGKVTESFSGQMNENQLEYKMDLDPALPLIDGDPDRIQQVVANLVSNAIKFTFPGGRINIGAALVENDEDERAFCRIWVEDTGIGIPQDKQTAIWERFVQAEGPVKEEGSGLGLGLAIVKSLVTAHGGRVWVESESGEGSCFTVLLPVERPSPSLMEAQATYPKLEETEEVVEAQE